MTISYLVTLTVGPLCVRPDVKTEVGVMDDRRARHVDRMAP